MVFFDTEFTHLKPIIDESSLISIGLVTEDGKRSFYAEINDSYSLEDCSDFVKQIVLPLLDAPALSEVAAFASGTYRRHHSLDDAKVMRLATLESKI